MGLKHNFSCCHVEDHSKVSCLHVAHGEEHIGADNHTAACEGSRTTADGYALKEDAAHGDPAPEQVPDRDGAHGEEPMPEQVFWQDL